MNDNKMREDFEAWFRAARPDYPQRDMFERVTSGERYISLECEWAYRGWMASRAALVVELPVPVEPECPEDAFEGDYLDGYNGELRMREDCRAAVEAAGVKVKP